MKILFTLSCGQGKTCPASCVYVDELADRSRPRLLHIVVIPWRGRVRSVSAASFRPCAPYNPLQSCLRFHGIAPRSQPDFQLLRIYGAIKKSPSTSSQESDDRPSSPSWGGTASRLFPTIAIQPARVALVGAQPPVPLVVPTVCTQGMYVWDGRSGQ